MGGESGSEWHGQVGWRVGVGAEVPVGLIEQDAAELGELLWALIAPKTIEQLAMRSPAWSAGS